MNTVHAQQSESMNARWLRWSLTAIALLLAVIALELSALSGPLLPAAQAQSPPDSGAQLLQLINAHNETNRLLQQILDHLRSGEVKVAIAGTDKGNGGTPAPAPRPGRPAGPKAQTAPRGQ